MISKRGSSYSSVFTIFVMVRKQIIKNILLFTLWTVIGAGTIMLLVAAIQQKDAKKCTGVNINISGASKIIFVDKNDILNTITAISNGGAAGKPIGSFDLKAIETALQRNVWVKNAQLYFDNNELLQVNVSEREPVARVFTSTGGTFYIDSSIAMLPLSDKFSARLPLFTGFPSDKKVLLKKDSNLLRDILAVSNAIRQDSFYMAMIEQVDITPQRTFEMIPKLGNNIIVFGDGKNAPEKLTKLQVFYKEVMLKAGWNRYSEINVQYNNQVVAKRKGAEEVKADSLRTLQLMKMIAENAERMAGDSLQAIIPDNEHNTTNNSIIQQSIERDDQNPTGSIDEHSPADTMKNKEAVSNPVNTVNSKDSSGSVHKPTAKPLLKKPVDTSRKPFFKPKPKEVTPKVLMPKTTHGAPQ